MDAAAGGRPEVLLEVEIPERLSGGGPTIFTADYLEHRGNRIRYGDVTAVAYNLSRNLLRFLSPHEALYYSVSTGSQTIGFLIAPRARVRMSEKLDAVDRILDITKEHIEPRVLERLVERIRQPEGRVAVGALELTADGYEKATLFSGTRRVLWTERIHPPEVADGKVILFKDHGGKPLVFCAVSLESENAVLLPALIESLRADSSR